MKANKNKSENRKEKGLELLADAAAAMLYSPEELEDVLASDEIHELTELSDNALNSKNTILRLGYDEHSDDDTSLAAEQSSEYK